MRGIQNDLRIQAAAVQGLQEVEEVIGTVYLNLYLSVRNSLVIMKSINN